MDDIIFQFFQFPATAVTASDWFQQNFRAEHQAQTLSSLILTLI
jgi:hypothetical protein